MSDNIFAKTNFGKPHRGSDPQSLRCENGDEHRGLPLRSTPKSQDGPRRTGERSFSDATGFRTVAANANQAESEPRTPRCDPLQPDLVLRFPPEAFIFSSFAT